MKRTTLAGISCLAAALFTILTISSCKKAGDKENDLEILDVNLLKSAAAFKKALSTRGSEAVVKFTIEDIKKENGFLNIKVRGGCSAEAFKIIWDGYTLESYPAQIRLVLTHTLATTDCGSDNEFLLMVDLQKIAGDKANSPDYVFHVANGSIIQDKTLHPNGTVTNN